MKMILTLCLVGFVHLSLASAPLVVHEWGTFTVLQDEAGASIPGVNINEESLPPFVNKLASNLAPDSHELGPLIGGGAFSSLRSKGIRRYYHAALMRMETPIIYLYPPKGEALKPVDINVKFRGGWITEWFPNADVDAPGYKTSHKTLMKDLTPETVGSITWNQVHTQPGAQSPETDFPVWLAPRETAAPALVTREGEVEDYLFYRGVANLQGPLQVIKSDDQWMIQPNPNATVSAAAMFPGMKMWLVEIKSDGSLQYRNVSPNGERAVTPMGFEKGSSDGDRLSLRADMKKVLLAEGLYEDEAEAMLNTWEVSYFRTPGLRLFFNLPQSWTDQVLPLAVSGYENTEVKRAMIGRVEMISDEQQGLMQKIARGPISTSHWFHNVWWKDVKPEQHAERAKKLRAGEATLEEFGMTVPEDYRAYMKLGRFRDALILHRLAKTGEPNLRQFALNYGLPLDR